LVSWSLYAITSSIYVNALIKKPYFTVEIIRGSFIHTLVKVVYTH